MRKFKVGDRVRRTSYFDENVASGRYFNGEPFVIAMINYHGGILDPDGMTHGPQYLEHVESKSPIRTAARRFIEDGIYDGINISDHRDGSVKVRMHMGDEGRRYTKAELDRALLILSQIAEFLDEDKGDE